MILFVLLKVNIHQTTLSINNKQLQNWLMYSLPWLFIFVSLNLHHNDKLNLKKKILQKKYIKQAKSTEQNGLSILNLNYYYISGLYCKWINFKYDKYLTSC